MKTWQQLPDKLAEADDSAVLTSLSDRGKVSVSGKELADQSESLAAGLAKEGIKAGDPVAVIGANSADWVIACLAVLRCGAVCVPMDAQFSDEQLRHVLNLSQPKLAFVSQRIAGRIENLSLDNPPRCLCLEKDTKPYWRHYISDKQHDFPERKPNDVALIFFTSGTTGPPKGVPLTHRNLMHQLDVFRGLQLADADDQMLMPLPLHHVYPFTVGLLVPLALGVAILFPAGLSSAQLSSALQEQPVTLILGLPRLYRALIAGIEYRIARLRWLLRLPVQGAVTLSLALRSRFGIRAGRWFLWPLHRRLAPELRMLVSGGAPLSPELALRLEGYGWQVGSGYGLTETSPLLTLNPPRSRQLKGVGKPVKGVEIRIENKQDGFGEVLAKGPNVFAGYLNDPDKTEAAFTEDGWYQTGDRGRLDSEGRLHLAGRFSTLIVTESGENIQPDEVEDAYAQHPAIKEIGVLERDHKLVGVVVPDPGGVVGDVKAALADALEEQARTLPSYQRLSGYEISRGKLPRTRLGKIRREKLEEQYDALREGEADDSAGAVPVEEMKKDDQALLEDEAAYSVWNMLGKRYANRKLSPDSSFAYDLGVDSLGWLELGFEIEEASGVKLRDSDIEQIETVRDLLQIVAEKTPDKSHTADADPMQRPEKVLSEKQQRWLRPLSPFLRHVAACGYHINRALFKLYFQLGVTGKARLPDEGGCLIIPNHASYLDPPALAAALDNKTLLRTHWAGAQEIITSNALLRFVARAARVVPVSPRAGARVSLAYGATILNAGNPLVWFPEGRMARSGKLQPFQPGAAMLAAHFRVPLIPVTIEGSHHALPPGRWWPRPRKIKVCFGEALDANQLAKEGDGEKAYQRINDALHRRLREQLHDESALT